MKYMLWRI